METILYWIASAFVDKAGNPDAVRIIIAASLAVSEAFALIPQVKSNGIFHLIVNIIKRLAKKG